MGNNKFKMIAKIKISFNHVKLKKYAIRIIKASKNLINFVIEANFIADEISDVKSVSSSLFIEISPFFVILEVNYFI